MFYTCTSRVRPDCSNKPVFSYVLLATSKSDNPLDGFQGPFYVDVTGLSPTTLQARCLLRCKQSEADRSCGLLTMLSSRHGLPC